MPKGIAPPVSSPDGRVAIDRLLRQIDVAKGFGAKREHFKAVAATAVALSEWSQAYQDLRTPPQKSRFITDTIRSLRLAGIAESMVDYALHQLGFSLGAIEAQKEAVTLEDATPRPSGPSRSPRRL